MNRELPLRVVALAPPDHAEGELGRGVLTGADPASLFNACRYAASLAVKGVSAWGESNWTGDRKSRRRSFILLDSLKEDVAAFEELLHEQQPNLLIIGSMTVCFPGAIACAALAKQMFGDRICIVLGGRHPSETVYASPEGEIVHHPGSPLELMRNGTIGRVFDIVVAGQGEYLIAQLGEIVADLEKRGVPAVQARMDIDKLGACPGDWIVGRLDGQEIVTARGAGGDVDYNNLLPPCELFGISEAFDVFDGRPTAHVFSDTGRGCIFDCDFCSERYSVVGRPVQLSDSPERLFRQLEAAVRVVREDWPDKPGASAFVEDSTLLVGSKPALRKLAKLILDSGLDIQFGAQLTVDQILLRQEELKLLRKAGLSYMFVGVETMDSEVSLTLSKNAKKASDERWIDRSFQALLSLHQMGIKSCVALVFGLGEPHESRMDVLSKVKAWRSTYGFPARLSMNWGVQHPLQTLRNDGSDYTYHEWSVPPGPFLEQFKNFGESTYRYPMHGVERPVLSELVEVSEFAREIVELKPGDAPAPPRSLARETIWVEAAQSTC
ncbi:MAG: B12-binding domain/radical SAM domain-containing protein [Pseudomonadota bacterium]